MADGSHPEQDTWRVVVFTNIPGGAMYLMLEEVLRPLGHRGSAARNDMDSRWTAATARRIAATEAA